MCEKLYVSFIYARKPLEKDLWKFHNGTLVLWMMINTRNDYLPSGGVDMSPRYSEKGLINVK